MGLSLLLSGNSHFDLIMANINSPDLHGFNLLQQGVVMNLPVILMSDEDDAFIAMRALQNGAFLCMTKPAKMEMLTCLWQHVLRVKKQIYKEKERLNAIEVNNANEGGEYDLENHKKRIKRKTHIQWTQELHEKFMDAIAQLGEGRCFPKEIQELMKVPGLTRMQIASHLQKCRNHNWLGPQERKSHPACTPSQEKPRKFGSLPQLGNTSSFHFKIQESHEISTDKESMPNDGRHGNRPIAPMVPSDQPHYDPFLSSSSNAISAKNLSSNHRHQSNDIYDFPDIGGLIGEQNQG